MIDGGTQLLFMVGHPVRQTKSPALLNAWFAENHLPVALVPVDVAPAGLAAFMLALRSIRNAWGVIFTIPHKSHAVSFLDSLSPVAQCLQAVNVARRTREERWEGGMLDGVAVINALAEVDVAVKDRVVHLVGCGGAGSATAYSVAAAGAAMLTLHDHEEGKASALLRLLQPVFPHCVMRTGPGGLDAAEIVVNTSPLGMRTCDLLPFDLDAVKKETVVVDAVTSESRTRLAAECDERGLRVVTGNTLARAQQPLILAYLLDDGVMSGVPQKSQIS